jgi:hypothetical protein
MSWLALSLGNQADGCVATFRDLVSRDRRYVNQAESNNYYCYNKLP